MKIQNVTDASFRKYGKIIMEYSFENILKEMEHTPLPQDVVYVPPVEELEVSRILYQKNIRYIFHTQAGQSRSRKTGLCGVWKG